MALVFPKWDEGMIIDVPELALDRRGEITINGHAVNKRELLDTLRLFYGNSRISRIYIAAAPTLRYGKVVEIVDLVKGVGVRRVVMVPQEWWTNRLREIEAWEAVRSAQKQPSPKGDR